MNNSDLNRFIQPDYHFKKEDILILQNIIQKHPWFQLAHHFLAKACYQNSTNDYKTCLNSAAFYSNVSDALYKYIYDEKGKANETSNEIIELKNNFTIEKDGEEKEINSVENHKEIIKNRLAEIEKENETASESLEEKKLLNTNIAIEDKQDVVVNEELADKKDDSSYSSFIEKGEDNIINTDELSEFSKLGGKLEQTSILNKFIQNEPSINRPADGPYGETLRLAKESLEDRLDVVSETLAEIYYKQDNAQKAVKIYKQLILKVPEKKRYFAARIKEILENK